MSFGPSEYAHLAMGKLFESDILLSEQYYSTLRKSHHDNPERRLMAAVLEDVVACLSVDVRRCSRRQRRDFNDARNWLNAPNDSDWVFSFSNICEALGIDPDYLRAGLNRWQITCRDRPGALSGSRPNRSGLRHKHFRLRA
ncbi:MAG: hypothetical protein EXR70_18690 [Deltaproteobacteria bacterium]|nr:hypothetical protein [Deltaproteobacteria bacterium]